MPGSATSADRGVHASPRVVAQPPERVRVMAAQPSLNDLFMLRGVMHAEWCLLVVGFACLLCARA
ncbi:MAG: hypothetical protein EP330_00125 [Deltaproteobacteria bacterium]|nr:MAG: hypothetical protein EP330_00125 [Deltaproteobacteria bacterium]